MASKFSIKFIYYIFLFNILRSMGTSRRQILLLVGKINLKDKLTINCFIFEFLQIAFTIFRVQYGWTSSVARVLCALGQETFLRSCQQRLQSLKWKIGANVWTTQKQNIYYNYFSEGNKTHFSNRNEINKDARVSGCNNMGDLGGEIPTLRWFLVFIKKIRIFKHNLF